MKTCLRSFALAAVIFGGAAPLQGCIVATAVGAATNVAATGVKAGAKVAGTAVGVTADTVGAAGHAVTGGK